MSIRKDKIQLEIEINGQKAVATYDQMKMTARDLNRELLHLTPGTQQFIDKSNQLRDVNNRLELVRQTVRGLESPLQRADRFLGQFGLSLRSVSFAGIAAGAFSALKSIVSTTAGYQDYIATLKTATGSQEEALKSFDLVKDIATGTVFTLEEMTEGYIKLRNRGINPTKSEIMSLADLASSQGKSFNELVEALLDAQVGEFERLKEFGIRASKAGGQASLSFKDFNTTVGLTPANITKVLIDMGKIDGVAGSNAEKMSNLNGMWSNIKDTFGQISAGIGGSISGFLSRLGQNFLGVANSVKEYISPTKTAIETTRELQNEFNFEIETLKNLNPQSDQRGLLIAEINKKYGEYLPNLLSESASLDDISKAQDAVNKTFKQKLLFMALEETMAQKQKELREAIKRQAAAELADAKTRANVQNLLDQGMSEAQIKQYKETNNSFLGAVKEGSKSIQDEIMQSIKDETDAYNRLFNELGTSIEQASKQFATKPDAGGNLGSSQSSTKGKSKKAEKQFSDIKDRMDINIPTTLKLAQDADDKLREDEAKRVLEYYENRDDEAKKAMDNRLQSMESAANRELTLEESNFIKKITKEEQFELNKIDIQLKYADQRLQYLQELGLQELEIYKDTELEKLKLQNDRAKQEYENEQRTLKLKEAISNQSINTSKNAIDAGIALLSKDENARRKNASAIKSFETANVLVNLYSEISGYFKGYSKFPFIGQILAIANAGIATARAYGAISKIKAQKFDGGGLVQIENGLITAQPNIPTQPGGDNILATVKVGEVMLNKLQQARLGGPRALRAAGVPGFNEGGTVFSLSPRQNNNLGPLSNTSLDKAVQMFEKAVSIFASTKISADVSYFDLQKRNKEMTFIKKLANS